MLKNRVTFADRGSLFFLQDAEGDTALHYAAFG